MKYIVLLLALVLIVPLFVSLKVSAQEQPIFDPSQNITISLKALAQSLQPGTVVLMGESHANKEGGSLDQELQAELLFELQKRFPGKVDYGMEFLNYTVQPVVNEYIEGKLTEAEFIQQSGWGHDDFAAYRPAMQAPQQTGGWLVALNAPRELTRQVSRHGLDSLSEAQQALMPPNFEVGRPIYRERFFEVIGIVHGNPNPAFDNMFVAQCIWDDTMAWQIAEHMKAHPQHILVVQAGSFHVEYGGGIEDRLNERGITNVVSVRQTSQLSDEHIQELTEEHPKYGWSADYIW